MAMRQPEEVPRRIDVGGTLFRTSLHTLMNDSRASAAFTSGPSVARSSASPLAAAARGTCALCLRRTCSMAWSTLSTPTRRPGPAGSSSCALARRARCPLWRQGRCGIGSSATPGARGSRSSQMGWGSSWTGAPRIHLCRNECMLAGCNFDGADMVEANLGGGEPDRSKAEWKQPVELQSQGISQAPTFKALTSRRAPCGALICAPT
jgi:hypothetical protein